MPEHVQLGSEPIRLDLGKLEVFLEATRCGNYTAAARRLHVTQSAVSHAIRKLEAAVGRRLVEWRRRRFTLTDDGEYVRQVCEQVFHDLGQAEHVLSARAPGRTQAITVGATVEFGTTVLVRKLRPLLDAAPWLHIDFRFRDDLAQLLLRDEIDLAVDCAPHAHPSIQATRLFREKYLIVASPGVPRVRIPSAGPSISSGCRCCRSTRSGALVDQRAPVDPRAPASGARQIIEVNQVRGMVHAALEGYGVALLPKYTVLGKVARGDLAALFPRLRLLEDWFCVYQKRARRGAREEPRRHRVPAPAGHGGVRRCDPTHHRLTVELPRNAERGPDAQQQSSEPRKTRRYSAEAKHHCVNAATKASGTMTKSGRYPIRGRPKKNPVPPRRKRPAPMAHPNLRGAPCRGMGPHPVMGRRKTS